MRLSTLKEKYPKVDTKVVEALHEWAPAAKYASWMVRMVGKGEEPDKVLELVRDFHQRVERMPKDQRDLPSFKTVMALRKAVNKITAKSKRQQKKEQKGYARIFDGPTAEIYRVDTYEGMQLIGRDTKWCLTEEDTWPQYANHLIFVVVNKTKKRRDSFSKFALLLDFPFSMEEDEIIGFGKIQACGYALEEASEEIPSLDEFSVYDEQDRYDRGSGVQVELLKVLIGDGVLNEALRPSIRAYLKGASNPVFCNAMRTLSKGAALPVGEFVEMVGIVVEHKLFNVLSLLHHPKAKTKKGRLHVWSSRSRSPEGSREWDSLAHSPAIGIPEFLEMYLEDVEKRFRHTTSDNRKTIIGKALRVLMNSTHMSQGSKEVAMNWIGRWAFRMDNYKPNFKKPKAPTKRKMKRG